MFYNRGEVLSDQFDHFKLILFWVPECSFCKKNITKRDKVGIFCLRGGGGVTHSHLELNSFVCKFGHIILL